jgi:signal transduction histidine kinase
VAEERAAVARDVHDAIGHHLTAIRMQAAAAQHVAGSELPAVAGRALATIDEVAAAAITDVRGVLAALREPSASETITVDDDGTGPVPTPYAEGAGIRGMRERARLLGGTLRISAREPTGWRVEAQLPAGAEAR